MSGIPSQVLSEALQQCVRQARVEAAVFLTFRFEPAFFEQEVLPVLVDVPSQAPTVRLMMLEDALLRGRIGDVAVYYDRNGFEGGSARLDIRRIPIRQHGYFHPKNVLLLLKDEDSGTRRLVVATMSANLTRAGWWENVEVCHIEEVASGGRCGFRDDLRELIRRVKKAAVAESRHEALDRIDSFLARETSPYATQTSGGRLRPRIYCGPKSVPDWLDEVAGKRLDECCLEVISPYFDETHAAPLAALIRRFRPREVRVLLPRDSSGIAWCSRDYWEAVLGLKDELDVAGLRSIEWGRLPGHMLSMGGGKDAALRTVHAKVYRFFRRSDPYEALFVGSVNLTTAGHSGRGNFETGILVETENPRPGWWLEPEPDAPLDFTWEPEAKRSPSAKLGVRYFWDGGRAEVFWDDDSRSPSLRVEAQGKRLFDLPPLAPREWVELAPDHTESLRGVLQSTSVLTVHAGDAPPAEILVQEEGMAHKPSLLLTLPVEDILRYWALLTPEQKAAFLETRVEEVEANHLTLPAPKQTEPSSMFSTFAGIFQAFAALGKRLHNAFGEGRLHEVEHYLFGRKYDSLGQLLDRAVERMQDDDPVQLYVVALCAKQLVSQIRKQHREFARDRKDSFRKLKARIDDALKVRARLDVDPTLTRREFLEWYERWFLKALPPVPVEGP